MLVALCNCQGKCDGEGEGVCGDGRVLPLRTITGLRTTAWCIETGRCAPRGCVLVRGVGSNPRPATRAAPSRLYAPPVQPEGLSKPAQGGTCRKACPNPASVADAAKEPAAGQQSNHAAARPAPPLPLWPDAAREPAAGQQDEREDCGFRAVERDAGRALPQDLVRQPQLRGARGGSTACAACLACISCMMPPGTAAT